MLHLILSQTFLSTLILSLIFMLSTNRKLKIKSIFAAVYVVTMVGCDQTSNTPYITEIPWTLTGKWVVLDTHTHTKFSDGKYSVDEIVQYAQSNGCDALAITDHSDSGEDAATPEYFSAITAAREQYPNFILFGGIEWNIPPYGGREHVTVLLNPKLEAALLGDFKHQFEKKEAKSEDALRWLSSQLPSHQDAVLFYNHPSRKDEETQENFTDYLGWTEVNSLFAGFEGGPGHQKIDGAYRHKLSTVDRWDPVVAEIGGVWDTLLDHGHNVWGALASSDFHNEKGDYHPCEFARTHVQVPEKNPRGVLQALRAGSFWAGHGQILDHLLVVLSAPGLDIPLSPGEVARLESDSTIRISVAVKRGAGADSSPLQIELIGNGRSGHPELLDSKSLPLEKDSIDWTYSNLKDGADGRSVYFRVRVRKILENEPDLLAYSNPIRIVLR